VATKAKKGGAEQSREAESRGPDGGRQRFRQRERAGRKETRDERGGSPRERQPKRRGKDRGGIYWGRHPQAKTAAYVEPLLGGRHKIGK
jgi:hypothetical protein